MASTLQHRKPEDKNFWEEYLKKVIDEDVQLITRWQKVLDTLLVYVGLFIGVLTAFIIQVSTNTFQPSSGDATNNILISVYNHTMNASIPIDLQQYTLDRTVSSNEYLLYISLGVSITEAAFALVVSIWLNRYQRSLTRTGPTIQERIRQRHEDYTGLMEWRLPVLIEILPMVALVALALFATFISNFVFNTHPMSGIILEDIFITAFTIFVFTASFAAFIPGAPFHSPLSGFIRLAFQMLPNWSILGLVRVRTVFVTLFCVSVSVLYMVAWFVEFKVKFPTYYLIFLLFLVPISLLSLCQGSQNEPWKQPKPRLFTLATWLYIHFTIFICLSFAGANMSSFAPSAFFNSLRGVLLLVMTIGAMKMSRWLPDEGKPKIEGVAWMIKTQPSNDSTLTFQNAVELARNYPHLRYTFLKEILLILDSLITSMGDGEQDLNNEEKTYITLLAVLVDFEPCEASFWRNEAAMKRPELSEGLKDKLLGLRNGDSTTKADAEFILGKVGEVAGKESTAVVVDTIPSSTNRGVEP